MSPRSTNILSIEAETQDEISKVTSMTSCFPNENSPHDIINDQGSPPVFPERIIRLNVISACQTRNAERQSGSPESTQGHGFCPLHLLSSSINPFSDKDFRERVQAMKIVFDDKDMKNFWPTFWIAGAIIIVLFIIAVMVMSHW